MNKMRILMPDEYKISIKRDGNYGYMEYTEVVKRRKDISDDEWKKIADATVNIFKQAAKVAKVINDNIEEYDIEIVKNDLDEVVIKIKMKAKYSTIADSIVGEFIHNSNVGKLTISNIFSATLALIASKYTNRFIMGVSISDNSDKNEKEVK